MPRRRKTETNSEAGKEGRLRAVILTAQANEWQAVCRYLTDQREEGHPQGTLYQRGTFAVHSDGWDVAVAEIGTGNNIAALETERAVSHFQPEVAFYVGSAGGLKDVQVGDVVISTKVYGYESGKVTDEVFQLRPQVGNASYGLEQRARAEARSAAWLKRLDNDARQANPRAHLGPLAAGEIVIASNATQVLDFLRNHYNDALAVEMEGRGFLDAIRANQSVSAIIIRGISNLLYGTGGEATAESRRIAAESAAAFAFEMLSKLREPKETRHASSTPRKVATVSRHAREQAEPASPVTHSSHGISIRTASVEALASIIFGDLKPIWWLGGGSAVKSGIPLSEELFHKAAKWHYCHLNGRHFNDLEVKRSDWLQTVRHEPWYNPGSLADSYPAAVSHLLQPRDNRREFFLSLLNPEVPPSNGYERLVELMALKIVMMVLTPNFDRVLPDLCRSRARVHHVDVIDNAAAWRQLSTSPRHPFIAYLYNSLDDYIDRFGNEQICPPDSVVIERLKPVLRDHPLVVIGYRGAEEAMMHHLLSALLEATDYFHNGIYWCALNYTKPDDLHLLVRELAANMRGNFQVVPIDGFDELMEKLWAVYHRRRPPQVFTDAPPPQMKVPAPTFDMQPVDADADAELEWAGMRSRMVNYCEAMDIPVPEKVSREWLTGQLVDLDLAVRGDNAQIRPTKAGYLLFGYKPHERLPAARVLLRFHGSDGRAEEVVTGNLWVQLAAITDVLAEFNRPFRLKGEKSETVYPYPPLALKEVIVNALAHRRYDIEQPAVIEIFLDRISVTNPGGLIDEVAREFAGASIVSRLQHLQQESRKIKGYRNPAIADLFYGSGDMDKEGSGLPDVLRLVSENGGKVTFDPINDNAAFQVVIWSRPEAVDQQTRTATPTVISTRYAANLLEVAEAPDAVWQAPTKYSYAKDVWAATDAPWLPPFITYGQQIHTFFDLSDRANPLREVIDVRGISRIDTTEFADEDDGRRNLVQLMNVCLYRHMQHCELLVDKRRRRAFFARTKEGVRTVAYQARLRRSTRTVVKPILSPTTQKIRYWEHQSFSFGFERFGEAWVLQILPGYVFTRDGEWNFLSGERVNSLSTRRASRDYNNKVHTDLVFWSWVLSGGVQGLFALQMGPTTEELKRIRALLRKKAGRTKNKTVRGGKKAASIINLEHPQFLLNASLPALTVHSLVEIAENDDEALSELERKEQRKIEEELAVLAEELEEQIDD